MNVYGFTIIFLKEEDVLSKKLSKKEKMNFLNLSKKVKNDHLKLKSDDRLEVLSSINSPRYIIIYEDVKEDCKLLLSLTRELDIISDVKNSHKFIKEYLSTFKKETLIILCHEKLFKTILHEYGKKNYDLLKGLVIKGNEIKEIE